MPCGARFSAPVQADPGAYPASRTIGTGSFPGVKWPGRGADHPPPSKCGGHERVGLYIYSPSGSSWPVIGRTNEPTLTQQPSALAGGREELDENRIHCPHGKRMTIQTLS